MKRLILAATLVVGTLTASEARATHFHINFGFKASLSFGFSHHHGCDFGCWHWPCHPAPAIHHAPYLEPLGGYHHGYAGHAIPATTTSDDKGAEKLPAPKKEGEESTVQPSNAYNYYDSGSYYNSGSSYPTYGGYDFNSYNYGYGGYGYGYGY